MMKLSIRLSSMVRMWLSIVRREILRTCCHFLISGILFLSRSRERNTTHLLHSLPDQEMSSFFQQCYQQHFLPYFSPFFIYISLLFWLGHVDLVDYCSRFIFGNQYNVCLVFVEILYHRTIATGPFS